VLGMALFYGGLVQLLAGMWEFKTGNTFGAVAFSSYGGFWMGYAALFIDAFGFLDAYEGQGRQLDMDLAVFLLSWSIFSGLMTIAAHRTTAVLMFLLFTVHLTFLMLSIHHFCGSRFPIVQQTGGAFGIIAAFTAWYAAFASFFTSKTSLFQLPLWELDEIYIKWGWLHIDWLWIDERIRKEGWGGRLLATMEQYAGSKGIINVHLETTSFQALPFYQKQGYTVFGELPDMPPGHITYFLKKRQD